MGINLFHAFNVVGTVADYRSRREAGEGKVASLLGAYLNYRVMSSGPLMFASMAVTPLRKFGIERPQHNIQKIRRSFVAFSRGSTPDNELLNQSRAELMQSSVAANSSLRLSGSSFAGMEASVMHGKYR